MSRILATVVITFVATCRLTAADPSNPAPDIPRIDSFVESSAQPHENDAAVIWFDDFDHSKRQEQYPEKSGELTSAEKFGGSGMSLEMRYPKGRRGIGNRKIFFGDSPTHRPHVLRRDESFDDVYWRIYLKHPAEWQGGGPAKLSRATSLVPPGWRQAVIAHVWSKGDALTLDPASGVRNGRVVTTRYNDFGNLKWLGNRPASQFKLHGEDGLGWWVCVEARVKLNTPGQQDGLNQLWIDGRLEAERTNLDWRGDFKERGINAIFLEAYWNQGSPVDQSRWIDNFVVSTKPIGPVVAARNPVLIKTHYRGPGRLRAWQVEVAADSEGHQVVWRSGEIMNPQHVTIDHQQGEFLASLAGRSELGPNAIYYSRVRQQGSEGQWSAWSPWHQPLRTAP